MSEPLDYALLDKELDRTKTAAFLGKNAAFMAPLLCSLEFRWDEECETAATNGTEIIWNPHWFLTLKPEARKTVLMHELNHVARLHWLRQGTRKFKPWAKAGDYAINIDLFDDRYSFEGLTPLLDPKYRGLSQEQIYDLIEEEKDDQCAPWGPGTEPDVQEQLSPQAQQQVINAVVKAMNAAEAANRAGDIPGEIREMIREILKPVVRWEQYLYRWFQEKCSEDYSWKKLNRRYFHMPMPGREGESRLSHLIFYFDVSGSVTKEQEVRFFSEVRYIKDTFNPEKLTIVQFDTEIQAERTFSEHEPFEEIEIIGRGGTDLCPVREHMMEHNPTAAVVFSDLFVTPMEPGPECPVLWVAIDNRHAQVKLGQLIHIKA